MAIRNWLVVVFLGTFLQTYAQNYFEGTIRYDIAIEVVKDSTELREHLEGFYGKDLSINYWKDGNFKINYKKGQYATYESATGKFSFVAKSNGAQGDSSMKRLRFLKKQKSENVEVLGQSCECFTYVTEDVNEIIHTLTYCFSAETPKINYRSFRLCEDFFLKEYFETAERPYLKYIHETKYSKTTWTAYHIDYKTPEAFRER